uniref:Uncharacterized protein n=1 Tax=Cannabis sativa TaxID=3483 RepID=A0A803NU86_CANSA
MNLTYHVGVASPMGSKASRKETSPTPRTNSKGKWKWSMESPPPNRDPAEQPSRTEASFEVRLASKAARHAMKLVSWNARPLNIQERLDWGIITAWTNIFPEAALSFGFLWLDHRALELDNAPPACSKQRI